MPSRMVTCLAPGALLGPTHMGIAWRIDVERFTVCPNKVRPDWSMILVVAMTVKGELGDSRATTMIAMFGHPRVSNIA
jgi:hypothetical protein